MSTATYPITGIQAGVTPGAPVPVRMEVDDFFNSTDSTVRLQKNLLYRALSKFQSMDYSEKLSYFQVAGIHGMPHVPWDAPGSYHPQYCEHSTVLFGSWHRPYMALFEQRLYEIMVKEIIPEYPAAPAGQLLQAAEQFRLPYWDWALKKPRKDTEGNDIVTYDLPLVVKDRLVTVIMPDDRPTQIKNPFFNFAAGDDFGEYNITPVQISDPTSGEPYEAIPFDRSQATSRIRENPNSNVGVMGIFTSPDGVEENKGAAEAIDKAEWYQAIRAGVSGSWSLQQAVYRLLSDNYFDTYSQFVTTIKPTVSQDKKLYLSLEGIHNNIHNWTGGEYGHMGNVPVAGFDPIFYLHHANIDRILAIWQTLNPEKWWKEFLVKDPNTDATLRTMTPDDPLAPFHSDDKGTFHTANSVRNVESLGYTYPDIQHKAGETNEEYLARVRQNVKNLYGPSAGVQLTLSNHDILVNVSFEKFALGGVPFTVSVLLEGEVVGQVHNFSFVSKKKGQAAACINCRQQQEANVIVTGQVFATHSLVRAVKDTGKELHALSKEDIASYFEKHMTYKVKTPTKDDVLIPSLKVVPIIGRRGVSLVNARKDGISGSLYSAKPLDHGIVSLPSLSHAKLLEAKAEWAEDGTLRIHDLDDENKTYRVKLGKWEEYEPLLEKDKATDEA